MVGTREYVPDRHYDRGIFEPDILLPSQQWGGRYETTPERALMIAVMNLAIYDARRNGEYEQTLAWLRADEPGWPYSARNLCEALGIDRGRLIEQLEREVAGWVEPPGRHVDLVDGIDAMRAIHALREQLGTWAEVSRRTGLHHRTLKHVASGRSRRVNRRILDAVVRVEAEL